MGDNLDNSPYSLEGKIILVTGASSGIGRVISRILDQSGARLILMGRNLEELTKTLESLDSNKEHLLALFDLKDLHEIKKWMNEFTFKHSIKLDGAVHSAGIQYTLPLRINDIDHYEEIIRINFKAGVALLQSMLNKKYANSTFSFIFISSVMGSVGEAGITAYAASKGAINSFVKSAALELAPRKARVNAIAPGFVVSEMSDDLFEKLTEEQRRKIIAKHPLGIGSSEDVAYGVVYLLSEAAKWITGTVLTVDGGYTCH
jgi:NAD(P)-dependent dehydrogenase (short-subunit alcohol dehydrogenase family)